MPPAVWDQQKTLQRRGQYQINELDENIHRFMRATPLSGLARVGRGTPPLPSEFFAEGARARLRRFRVSKHHLIEEVSMTLMSLTRQLTKPGVNGEAAPPP